MDKSNKESSPTTNKSDSLLKNFIAGGVGGSCLVIAGHPLDTIKVRLQTQSMHPKPMYKGTWDCAKQVVKKESILGLYKGMAAPVAGVCPMYAICFFSFTVGKKLQQKSENYEFTPIELLKAGGLAGLATTAIIAPGERIKCLLQVQNANPSASGVKYAGPMDCAKQLYKQGGIRNIYLGTLATACRDVPATGVYFMTYEYLKRLFASNSGSKDGLSAGQTLLAGGFAGIANWLVAIPADVLKSKQQTAPPGTFSGLGDVLKKTLKSEGFSGLYKGATPTLLRAFPANAACFMGFETTMKLLNMIHPD